MESMGGQTYLEFAAERRCSLHLSHGSGSSSLLALRHREEQEGETRSAIRSMRSTIAGWEQGVVEQGDEGKRVGCGGTWYRSLTIMQSEGGSKKGNFSIPYR